MIFKPDLKLKRITDISKKHLDMLGVNCLLLDVDNTISTDHGAELADGVVLWIEKMKKEGIKLYILSNAKGYRIAPFAENLGLDYISLSMKPLPFGYLRGVRRAKGEIRKTAIVGDQIFTDILGGSFSGVKKILLTPIKPEDKLSFKIRRKLERYIFKIYKIKDYGEE